MFKVNYFEIVKLFLFQYFLRLPLLCTSTEKKKENYYSKFCSSQSILLPFCYCYELPATWKANAATLLAADYYSKGYLKNRFISLGRVVMSHTYKISVLKKEIFCPSHTYVIPSVPFYSFTLPRFDSVPQSFYFLAVS